MLGTGLVGLGVLSRAGNSTEEADPGTVATQGSMTAKWQLKIPEREKFGLGVWTLI